MTSKINWLVNHSSQGMLILQPWLTQHGISHSLTQKYVASGWLKKWATGVYYRPFINEARQPDWVAALYALPNQLNFPAHLAGLSSLHQHGLSHYLSLHNNVVWVGVKKKQNLPKWFREFADQKWQYSGNHKLTELIEKDFTEVSVNGVTLTASCPELAAYEVVDAINKPLRFEYVADIFQGLVNLSPRKVQSLLNRSHAVQTNRIFLYLANYYHHQWFQRLNISQITLGSGKRQVVPHGVYDKKYRITVPASFALKKEYHG